MPGLMLNEDNSHFFSSRSEEDMTVEGLKRMVDNYAGAQVKDILFCPNAMRTSYASDVWQPIWDGYDPQAGDDQPFFAGTSCMDVKARRRWPHHAWTLHRKGIDPYAVWLEYAREKGISPWLSMRMNDIHDVDNPSSFMHSDLWKERPDLRRTPCRQMLSWPDVAFDYGKAEVRAHHLALVREYLERYDMDGLELDWMRFGFHFRPGEEAQGRQILTAFMAEVRQLAQRASARRGHEIEIGVRVPSRPQAARDLGMDAVEWARRGLVDLIVVTPFWATIEFDMPIELWKELLDETPVMLAAGLEVLLRPFPEAVDGHLLNTAETVRGAAASLLYRGAERIYLFNYMDSQTTVALEEDYRAILGQSGELASACAHPRRHVVTYSDTHPPGQPAPRALPCPCGSGHLAQFRLHIGPRPSAGRAWAVLGCGESEPADAAGLAVWVNGERCEFDGESSAPMHPVVRRAWTFGIPDNTLRDGYNVVEALGESADPCQILWSEVRIEPA